MSLKRFIKPPSSLNLLVAILWVVILGWAEATTHPPAPSNPVPTTETVFLSLHPGLTIPEILKKHGFSDSQITTISQQNLLPKGLALANGKIYRLHQSQDRQFAEVKIYEPLRNWAFVFWRHGEQAGSVKKQEPFKVQQKTVQGHIEGSLVASILKFLPDEWVAWRFLDAYSLDNGSHLSKRLQKGAKFKFTVETKWDGSHLIGYGDILKTSLEIGPNIEQRYFFPTPGGGTFLNPENSYANRPLFAPVNYLRVSSFFDPLRMHPIKRRLQPHLGVDFELPEGTDVFAAQAGEIVRIGQNRAAGKFIVIRHENDDVETSYDHLKWIDPNLKPLEHVHNGQKIAEVGCSGYCTRPHLHFAVQKKGRYVDPLLYVKSYTFNSQSLVSAHFSTPF